jgi:hypothetical protein
MQGPSSTSPGVTGRGSTIAAVGTMTAIALVAASAFVILTRLAPVGQRPAASQVEQPPALLADGGRPGDVPVTVPPEVQGPVIGVRNAAQLPDNALACDVPELGDDVKAEGVRVTPEVVLLDVVTDPPGVGTQRLVCITWRQGSAWSTVTTVSLDEHGGTIPFGYFCCSEGGRGVAGAVVQAPEGTRWVLQERPGWWLAYPVGEHLAVPVLWSFQHSRFGAVSAPVSHVLYLDDEGEVLDEAFLRV